MVNIELVLLYWGIGKESPGEEEERTSRSGSPDSDTVAMCSEFGQNLFPKLIDMLFQFV